MAKIYQETGDSNVKSQLEPFSFAELKAAAQIGAPQLVWFNDHDEPAWQPFIVHLLQLDANQDLHFQFIESDQTGNVVEIATVCTVNLNNRDDVWIEHPSTLDSKMLGTPPAGKEYALLFLSKLYTDRRPQSVPAGQAGTKSKWPKGSEWAAPYKQTIRRLVDLLGPKFNEIPNEDRAQIEKLLAPTQDR